MLLRLFLLKSIKKSKHSKKSPSHAPRDHVKRMQSALKAVVIA